MEFPDILGISLNDWAAASTLINQGISQAKVLEVLSVESPVWQEATLHWNDLLEKNQDIAIQYGKVFLNPYIGKFKALKPTETSEKRKELDIDAYYSVFCHIEEAQKHGIDFLSILETHHQLKWEDWSEMIRNHLDYELAISKNGTREEQERLQKKTQASTTKWQAHWADYYKDKNLNLTSDINF